VAITLVNGAALTMNTGEGTLLTIDLGTPASSGNVLIATIASSGGTARVFTVPDGWILIRRQNNGTNPANGTYYKIATASEPTTYDFIIDAAVATSISLIALSGVDTTNPIAGDGFANGTTSATITYGPTISTTNHGRLMKTVAGRSTTGPAEVIDGGPNTTVLVQDCNATPTCMLTSIMIDASVSNGTFTPEDSQMDISCQKATISFVLNESRPGGDIEFGEYFENGTHAATISTGNTNFNIVEGTGTATFSATYAAEGNLSGMFVSSGAAGNFINGQHSFSGNVSKFYLRFAVYINTWPSAITYISFGSCLSGVSPSLRIDTGGTITLRNNNIAVATTSNTVPISQWFLIEWMIDSTSSLQAVRLYNTPSGSPTLEMVNGLYDQGPLTDFKVGLPATVASTVWIDAVASSLNDWVGPLSATPPIAWLRG
jgi:hypothetical protein